MIDLFGEEIIENGSLRERFGVNPFTIIDQNCVIIAGTSLSII